MGSDRELAEAVARRGDERAFRELYRRHTPRLYQFLLRLVGGKETDAEDAAQETWLRAARQLERFRWESAFSTWLAGIGLNVVRDLVRGRARERTDPWAEPPRTAVEPPALAERLDLERAIAALPNGYRVVLVLHDIEGMKHREVAARLGITEGTSKSQLFGARKLLRNLLRSPEERDHVRERPDTE